MPDSNLNTSIAAMRTSILNSVVTATADELVDLSRSAKSLNLIEDSAVEVAINNRSLSLLNAGASHEEMIKISKAVKSILSSTATTTNITNETTFGASIIPDADISYDLGSTTNRFRDVYLDGNTINIGAQTIKSSASSIEVEELTIGSGVNKVKLGATLDGKLERTGTDSNGVTDVPRTATPGTAVVVNFSDLLSITSPTAGQSVLVTSTNKIYINNGSGWYEIGDITNASPVGITDVNASYNAIIGGSPIVITAVSTDPEADTLTWSYILTSGSLNGTTVTNVDNVFTITPHATQIATFELSIGVSDSINSTVSAVTTITIADSNEAPTAITGVNSTYQLDVGAAAQTITAISSDAQGDSLTWSYTTSGSLNGTTVTQPYANQTQKIQVSSYVLSGRISWDDDGDTLIMSAPERAFIWHRTGDVWTQAAELQPQVADQIDGFASAISMSGDGATAIVGVPDADHIAGDGTVTGQTGAIYIYSRSGNSWSLQERIEMPSIIHQTGNFGTAVNLSRDGDVMLVNSQAHNLNPATGAILNYRYGKSYLYTRSGTTWSNIQTIAGGFATDSRFGYYQSLSGDGKQSVFHNRGDSNGGSNTGSISFYSRTTGNFTNIASRIKGSTWMAGDRYGESLAMDYLGETCVVGTPLYDNGKGNVHVWTRSGSTWTEQQDISNPLSTGSFGSDVDITSDGNMIIIGAYGSSKIYIYERNGSTWTETASFDADDTTSGDQLGIFVQVNDNKDKFIASSPGQTDGATYYFKNAENVFTITPHSSQASNFNVVISVSDGVYQVDTTTTITIAAATPGPTAITGVAGTYSLDVGGAAQTITAISSHPQGTALTWSWNPAGSSLNLTTITNVDNVFTITPHTSLESSSLITIYASDGEYQVEHMFTLFVHNDSPSVITGYSGSYTLATDTTPTILTLGGGIDPESQSVTWSHSVNSGALNGTTVSNVDNVFTITPHVSLSTSFTIIISATDGVNSTSTTSITFTLTHVAAATVLTTFTNPNATTDIGGVDGFGWSVNLTANNIIIHAPEEDGPSPTLHNNSGRAYIYNKTYPYSLQRNKLNPASYGSEDTSGNAIGYYSASNHNGDLMYIGNRMKDSSTTSWVGEAYSYRLTDGWTMTTPSPTTTLDMFGDSIDCSHTNNKVVIGSSYYGNYVGRMYLYTVTPSTGYLTLSATYQNPDGNISSSYFARRAVVSHNGYYVAAGSTSWPGYGINGYGTGRVWIFNNTSTSLQSTIQAPYFNNDGSGYADSNFGVNIHFISDDKLLVCAARMTNSQTPSYSVYKVYTINGSGGSSTLSYTVTLPSGEGTPYERGIASSNGYYAMILTTKVEIRLVSNGTVVHTINEVVNDIDMTVSGTTATVITGVANGTCKLWTIPL